MKSDQTPHKMKTLVDSWSTELKRDFLPSLTIPEVWNGPTSNRALVFALRKSSKWGAQDVVQKQREIKQLERDRAKSSLLSALRGMNDSPALNDLSTEQTPGLGLNQMELEVEQLQCELEKLMIGTAEPSSLSAPGGAAPSYIPNASSPFQLPALGVSALPLLKLTVPQMTELLGEYEHSGPASRSLKVSVKAHRKCFSARRCSKWGAQDVVQKQREIKQLERDRAKSSLLSALRGMNDSPALNDLSTEQTPGLGLNQMELEVEQLQCELEKLMIGTAEPSSLSAPGGAAPSYIPNASSPFQLPALGVSALPLLKLTAPQITELLGEYEHSGPASRSLKVSVKAHRKCFSARRFAV